MAVRAEGETLIIRPVAEAMSRHRFAAYKLKTAGSRK
jgi:hypothetical protein